MINNECSFSKKLYIFPKITKNTFTLMKLMNILMAITLDYNHPSIDFYIAK